MSYTSQIEAAPGHPGANSYVTVDEAENYFASRYPKPAAWFCGGHHQNGVPDPDEILEKKERALISASRMIGTQAFGVRPFSEAMGWIKPQGLFFPAEGHPFLTGKADSGDEETVVDQSLAGEYPDGYFVGAGMHVIAGANIHQARLVTDFEAATGALTVSPAFPEATDPSTSYFLIWPLPMTTYL